MSTNAIINNSAKDILKKHIYSGKTFIDSVEEVSTEGAAVAQISKADTVVPENIKEDITILGVTGTCKESSGLKFSTVAYTYREAEQFLHEHGYLVYLSAYPFFYFTDIAQELENNQFYAISSRDPRDPDSYYDIGQVVRENAVEEVIPGRMVLHYSNDSAVTIDALDAIESDNITLYIAERIPDAENVRIIAKGSSKLNALYPFSFGVGRSGAAEEDSENNIVEVLKNGQVIETLYSGVKDVRTETTLYNVEYQLRAYKAGHTDISVWGILDSDAHYDAERINYQYPTVFKANKFPSSTEYTNVWYNYNSDIRELRKEGLPFEVICESKRTDDKVIYDFYTTFVTYEPAIEGKHIVFRVDNQYTGETIDLDARYYDKEGEDHYWDWSGYLLEGFEGTENSQITITCLQKDYRKGVYIKGEDSDIAFNLLDGHADIIREGSFLEEMNEYSVEVVDAEYFPLGTRLFINNILVETLDHETSSIYFELDREYISADDEVIITIKRPVTAHIHMDNRFGRVAMYIRSFNGAYSKAFPAGELIDEDVPVGRYYIGAMTKEYQATLLTGSVYQGQELQESFEMAKTYIMQAMLWGMSCPQIDVSDSFNLLQNDSLNFNIVQPTRDYISIDNTQSYYPVNISAMKTMFPRDILVNSGESYNLSADQYMISRENYYIEVQPGVSAQWLAADSDAPIDLTISASTNRVLTPEGGDYWYVSYNGFNGYLGTIIFTSENPKPDPEPPTPETGITIYNNGNSSLYASGIKIAANSNYTINSGFGFIQIDPEGLTDETAIFHGEYKGIEYDNFALSWGKKGSVNAPDGDTTWYFDQGDGTLTISEE